MERVEIEAKLNELLVEELGLDADKITPDARFEEDLEASPSMLWRPDSSKRT
jgi:acyl carrier protein